MVPIINKKQIGIEALNIYGGSACIQVQDIFTGRGLDAERFGNLMMKERAVSLPFEDPVTNAVNAAKPIVDRLNEEEKSSIEILITSSESGIDLSKSIASYVHKYLDLSPHCRLIEMKQACYSATAAVQLALSYVASNISPKAKALIIATDMSLVDAEAEYAEPTTGTGGVAILISDNPRVFTFDLGAFGSYSFETMDTARPTPQLDIVDIDQSLIAYLSCLTNSFRHYQSRVEEVDFVTTFDYLAMHTPFAGMVKAGHRKAMREFTKASSHEIENDFSKRVAPSLVYPGLVGNMFSGSLYLALGSLIDHSEPDSVMRVGLYAYGSGCSSEFFSGYIDNQSRQVLAEMQINQTLHNRKRLTFEEYDQLLFENKRCLVPEKERTIPVDQYASILASTSPRPGKLLALKTIQNYHRQYRWLE